jgi:multicomponent Na+:H+ antiporter subunit C
MSAALAVAVLTAGGVFMILQKGLVRVTFGFILLGHAANLLLVAAGGMGRRGVPIIGWTSPDLAADPLPQAFALTAIVITFGITVYLLGLSSAGADDLAEGPADDAESVDAAVDAATDLADDVATTDLAEDAETAGDEGRVAPW